MILAFCFAAGINSSAISIPTSLPWPCTARSQRRASAWGAHLSGSPYALARALEKLDAYSKRLPMQASPNTAHLFIVAPMIGGGIAGLFSTHLPMAQRIERLIGRSSLSGVQR